MAGRSEDYKLIIIGTLKKLRRPCTTLDLATNLGKKRGDINPHLYEMQRLGLIKKVNESNPPKWDLTTAGSTYGAVRKPTTPSPLGGRGRGRGILSRAGRSPSGTGLGRQEESNGTDSQSPFSFHSFIRTSPAKATPTSNEGRGSLEVGLLGVLRGASKPLTALDVAHKVGLKTRKEVNPTLYAMEKEGVVTRTDPAQGPPLWELRREVGGASVGGASYLSGVMGRRGEEMEVQDLSHVSEGNLKERLLQVMGATPRTELELRNATGTRASRSEVQAMLESLLGEGRVQRSESTPTQWWVPPPKPLSQLPEGGGLRERLLMVLGTSPQLKRTELELCKAVETSTTRVEVKKVLDALLSEGRVQKTFSIPTKWSLVTTLNPNATPFVPATTNTPISIGMPSLLPKIQSSPVKVSSPPPPAAAAASFSASVVNDMNKNPVSALMEYAQQSKVELVFLDVREYGPPHMKHFVTAAQLGGVRYPEAESTSKKEAKRMAADLALQGIQQQQTLKQVISSPPPPLSPSGGTTPTSFADRIAELSHRRFTEVQASVEVPQPGRKVIAAFVMEDALSGEMRVVSVGSGTRCITGDHISLEGLVVNDCHAEVVARRSLIRFFYRQLSIYHQDDPSDTIFESDANSGGGMVRVRPHLKFHLYISTAPCGDGAQFSRGDDLNRDPPAEGSGHTPTMQSKLQGLLRTKMEGGEGTIPIGEDATPLTWDGVMQGGRLRTMSCSDKVGRWNVLGLQGALLSLFMSPIYMSSLTLGSLHHHGHLSRAVCCRFAGMGGGGGMASDYHALPDGFSVNHPLLGRVGGGDKMQRHTEKTSNFSVNWALGDERGELVDGRNGSPVPPQGLLRGHAPFTPSRVAKIRLYAEFVRLAQVCNRGELLSAGSYKETKELASAFQKAKQMLYRHCMERGYGSWMRKPVEQEQFGMAVLDRLKETSIQ